MRTSLHLSRLLGLAGLACLGVAVLASPAGAQTISLNFDPVNGKSNSYSYYHQTGTVITCNSVSLTQSMVAGAPNAAIGSVAVANWNNIDVSQNKPFPTVSAGLIDSNGNATTLSVAIPNTGYAANGLFNEYDPQNHPTAASTYTEYDAATLTDPNQILMNGFWTVEKDGNNSPGSATTQLTNIPYATYSIILYATGRYYSGGSESIMCSLYTGNSIGSTSLVGTTYAANGPGGDAYSNLVAVDAGASEFTEATSTDPANPSNAGTNENGPNFMEWDNVSGSAAEVDVSLNPAFTNTAQVFGIQIVNASPEPASLVLLAIGGLLVLPRRRRA
jgi:hypothetical protein